MEDINTLVKNMIDLRNPPTSTQKQSQLNLLIRQYIGDLLKNEEPNEERKNELKREIDRQNIDVRLKGILKHHVDKNGFAFIDVGGSRKKRKRRKYRKTRQKTM